MMVEHSSLLYTLSYLYQYTVPLYSWTILGYISPDKSIYTRWYINWLIDWYIDISLSISYSLLKYPTNQHQTLEKVPWSLGSCANVSNPPVHRTLLLCPRHHRNRTTSSSFLHLRSVHSISPFVNKPGQRMTSEKSTNSVSVLDVTFTGLCRER